MSSITSYKTTAFKESQKFFVIDPSTSSPSFVLGSDLVSYITPMLNYVRAQSTRLAAENTDYDVGTLVQTSGATAPGDNRGSVYLVVEGGTGDFPMLNGNDLLVIAGDDSLRALLESEDPGNGAAIVAMEGGPSVQVAVVNRVIRAASIAGVEALTPSPDFQVSLAGSQAGIFEFDGSDLSAEVAADPSQIDYIAPSSDPTGASGAWVRVQEFYDNSDSTLSASTYKDAVDELDAESVKTTGDQTINGTKTFIQPPELDGVTGTATFTNSSNNINLTGIGLISSLEVGDVIQVSGSISNNSEFTVEVITDNDNVIVNQAHAGGTTSKSLVDETSTVGVTVQLLAKRYDAQTGFGQGWVDVTSSRSSGVIYTNSTGRPIDVLIRCTAGGGSQVFFSVDIDGVTVSDPAFTNVGSNNRLESRLIIPASSTYSLSIGAGSLLSWWELR